VRIGEELSDIEEDCSNDANNVLNVSRIVDINF